MGNKRLEITVCGKSDKWEFTFYGDPSNLKTWRDDGLDVNEVINVVPEWIVNVGWTIPFCILQDLVYFTVGVFVLIFYICLRGK